MRKVTIEGFQLYRYFVIIVIPPTPPVTSLEGSKNKLKRQAEKNKVISNNKYRLPNFFL